MSFPLRQHHLISMNGNIIQLDRQLNLGKNYKIDNNYLEQKYANINLNLGNKKYLNFFARDNRSICIYQIQTSDEILNILYLQQIEKILNNCSNT
jgi:hypothetical protein